MRPLNRLAAFTHPVAAAILATMAWLFIWKMGAIAVPELSNELRSLPLPGRFDTRVGFPAAILAAALVTLVWRGRAAVWVRRGLAGLGLGLLLLVAFSAARALRHDCYRLGGCDASRLAWLYVDVTATLAASVSLLWLARHDPAPRLRWGGLGLVVVLALASSSWTYWETRALERYTGDQLARVHLEGYFATHTPFVPGEASADPPGADRPAVPMLPMLGDRMICAGDWRVVPFPDRSRCLPHRPLLRLEARDVTSIDVSRPLVGAPPAIFLTLRGEAAGRMRAALRTARSHRLVLVNRQGELVVDASVDREVPGQTFLINLGDSQGELRRTVRALLGSAGHP